MPAPGVGAVESVDGLKVGRKAGEALHEIDDRAHNPYVQAQKALLPPIHALEELDSASAGESAAYTGPDVPELLIAEDIALQHEISRFETSLGRGAEPGSYRGTLKKLKFAPDHDKAIREHYGRIRPNVDAAIFQTLKSSMTQMEALRSENKEEFQNLTHKINQRLDGTSITERMLAHENKSNCRHAELTQMLQALAAASRSTSSARSSTKPKDSAAVTRLATAQRPKGVLQGSTQRPRPRKREQLADNGSTVPIEPESDTDHFLQRMKTTNRRLQQIASGTSIAAANVIDSARNFVSDWLLILFLLSLTTIYQTTSTRRMIIAQLQAAQKDPLLAALLSGLMVALLRRFGPLPRLITGLSDDSISLQTALGEDLLIPGVYWQSREIFHGFLEWHFRERPGRLWVVQRRYRVLLGGAAGIIVDDSKWSRVITARMNITMAMLLGNTGICPKCNEALLVDAVNLEAICVACRRQFSMLQERSASEVVNTHEYRTPAELFDGLAPHSTLDGPRSNWSSTMGEAARIDAAHISHFVNILLSSAFHLLARKPSNHRGQGKKRDEVVFLPLRSNDDLALIDRPRTSTPDPDRGDYRVFTAGVPGQSMQYFDHRGQAISPPDHRARIVNEERKTHPGATRTTEDFRSLVLRDVFGDPHCSNNPFFRSRGNTVTRLAAITQPSGEGATELENMPKVRGDSLKKRRFVTEQEVRWTDRFQRDIIWRDI